MLPISGFGEIARKPSHCQDYDLYEASPSLYLKADPYTSQDDIEKALAHLSTWKTIWYPPFRDCRIRKPALVEP
jgi:hypothetical protein